MKYIKCDFKPCPFCGNENIHLHYYGNLNSVSYYVKCDICECRTRGVFRKLNGYTDFEDVGFDCDQAHDAVELWNMRAHKGDE